MQKIFFQSPIGTIAVHYSIKGICYLQFVENESKNELENLDFLGFKIISELEKYFEDGTYQMDLPIDYAHGTDFQQKVWNALLNIPTGETKTYREIAEYIGQAQAAQAVGNANSQNDILLLLPCHRIIGSNDQLIGYRGEIWRKKWLLEHEGALQKSNQINLF
ncbi:MAG: Methylated-DNA--[protein]-cysteine S-methyltransferase [Bacteroidota bacterium]|jgi:methylated-DNA-[protein]-cysteine S-methyltransferase